MNSQVNSWWLFTVSFMTAVMLVVVAGACGCNKESVKYILSKKGTGNAACLAIGGALEALEAHPGTFTLNLSNKKGFIKCALQTG